MPAATHRKSSDTGAGSHICCSRLPWYWKINIVYIWFLNKDCTYCTAAPWNVKRNGEQKLIGKSCWGWIYYTRFTESCTSIYQCTSSLFRKPSFKDGYFLLSLTAVKQLFPCELMWYCIHLQVHWDSFASGMLRARFVILGERETHSYSFRVKKEEE